MASPHGSSSRRHIERRESMHKRLWLLAGAAVAVMILATSATATSKVAATARGAESAAAPFAWSWAQVPRTHEGRKAKSVLVFGVEQDVNGFNTNLACCNQLIGNFMGLTEAMHGAFIQNNTGLWVKDIVTDAKATPTTLSYSIRKDANWYWGGKKVPVTYKDFVYTLQQIVDPKNDLAGRTGYSNLDATNFTHKGDKQVTFKWKTTNCTQDFPCGPYANWQSIFSGLYPAQALAGQDFNKIWTNCICGSDGQPVANGPFYMSNYTKGQGTTLKVNPFWYGKKPGLAEIDFKIIADTNSEVQAMRGGEVDAITPTFGSTLLPLKGLSGITFNQIPGYYFEHIEFRELKGTSNLLTRAPWLRQAIALGIDRQSIIKTVYGDLAGNTKPMNNMVYYSTQAAYKPDFTMWNYNPAKAIALLKKHCTGGPTTASASNTAFWTCAGLPAKFRWSWTVSNQTRTNTEAIIKSQLKQIGIDITEYPRPANVIFGPNGLPGGDFDIAEFALITTGDPGDWYDTWRCGGDGNYMGYCNRTASKMMEAGNKELDPAKRTAIFQKANVLMTKDVPLIPLYQRPVPLIYKSDILGMKNNPALIGPFWNVEDWKWK
jgi:peptide/nickel transport system substrate-binding protein